MPNGGTDNCVECGLNKASQDNPRPRDEEQWKAISNDSYCTLRKLKISDPFYTYCENYYQRDSPSVGWVFAGGLHEDGYARIPWHDRIEPSVNVKSSCFICNKETSSKGIMIEIEDGKHLGFCSNRHYVEWWKTQHDDDTVRPEDYATPE